MITPKISQAARNPKRTGRLAAIAFTVVGVALVAAGCSGSNSTDAASTTTSTPTPTSSVGTGTGTVNVLYAGSLLDLMNNDIGPAFDKQTGFTFQGTGMGSGALATLIKGKTTKADVFISASPKTNASLEGASNGNWVSWYAQFASSKLVIGINPKSSFASELTSKPWYDVVGETGFKLGSTDALTDPKGALSVEALDNAATAENKPELATLAKSYNNVQPEESLVGRLQAGQLDAAFFYASEAKAANIETIPLTGQDLKASYTITEVAGAPNPAGAESFIEYLLGSDGQAAMKKLGYDITSPATVTGTGVPKALDAVLGK